MLRLLLVSLISLLLGSALVPATARADLASTVYGDVRDVVEELIQSEVAISVVAKVRARSPALGFYFADTLERLSSPYWGSLPRVFRGNLQVAVADLVYFHLSSPTPGGDIQQSAEHFFQCVVGIGEAGEACVRLRAALLEARRSLLDVECIRTPPRPERRVACDLGLAARAALAGRGSTRRHVMDAVSDVVLADVVGPLAPPLREILVTWLDHPDRLPTELIERLSVRDLGMALRDDALEKLCGDAQSLRGYLGNPDTGLGWVCFAISAKKLPELLQIKIEVTEDGKTIKGALPFWRIDPVLDAIAEGSFGDHALYTALAEVAFADHCKAAARGGSKDWPCGSARLSPGARVELAWLGVENLNATADGSGKLRGATPKELAVWMKRWQRVSEQHARLRALLPVSLRQYLFLPDTGQAQSVAAMRALTRMARLAQQIRERWYLWARDSRDLGDLDVGELLQLARQAAAVAADSAGDAGELAGAGARDLGDWFRLIVKADHRTLAIELLRAGLVMAAEDSDHPHERFFISLAAYVLDASGGDAQELTRSAFRAAAKELLLRAERHGVPRAADRFRLRLLPTLGVRVLVNEAHAVRDDDSTRRTTVAADWPTAMVAFSDYGGLQLSLLDLTAPLAELGLRPAGDYAEEQLIILDAARPRLGVWAAVPQLSRRLALSAGVGARFLGLDVESDAGRLQARYVRRTSLTIDLGVELVF